MGKPKKTGVKEKNKDVKQTRKPGAGRPLKLTDEVVTKLENAFLLGCPKIKACKHAGIHRMTLERYIEKHPEYSDRISELQGSTSLKARLTVRVAIEEGDAKIAMDYLKRKEKDEFSEKTEIGHSGEIKGSLVGTQLEEMNDINKELERLKKDLGIGTTTETG